MEGLARLKAQCVRLCVGTGRGMTVKLSRGEEECLGRCGAGLRRAAGLGMDDTVKII
jgi:hypothetical protein